LKPGSSRQRTGTHRLLAVVTAGGKGASSSGSTAAGAAGTACGAGKDAVGNGGALPHAASIPTMLSAVALTNCFMLLILLEALLALALLVLIVWWTMFSGRPGGEPPTPEAPPSPDHAKADTGGRDEPHTRKD
jgi:hypothetical protein